MFRRFPIQCLVTICENLQYVYFYNFPSHPSLLFQSLILFSAIRNAKSGRKRKGILAVLRFKICTHALKEKDQTIPGINQGSGRAKKCYH
jgi:hypothetical protein